MKTGRMMCGLLALLAQSMALSSTVCFYQCTGLDGHTVLEVIGQECHHAELLTDSHSAQWESDQHQVRESSGCTHSTLAASPQTLAKSAANDARWAAIVFADDMQLVSRDWSLTNREADALRRICQPPPTVSPHLQVLTIAVMRV